MLSPRVLLLLVLLVSTVGFAQSPPPLVPAPAPSEQPPPPADQATPPAEQPAPPADQALPPAEQPAPPAEQQPAPEGELFPHEYEPELAPDPGISAGRVMLELLGGGIGGTAGALIGGLLTGALYAASGGCDDATPTCGLTALVIIIPSIAIGTSLGVTMFGRFMDGEGLFSSTILGLAAGVGVALLAGVVTTSEPVLLTGLVAGPLIGAVIGYEISHANVIEARKKSPKKKKRDSDDIFSSRTRPQWTPMLGTTPHGGFFGGLAGRF